MTSAAPLPLRGQIAPKIRGRLGSLICGRARARSTPGPTAGDLVLLADARLVGEPDFYGVRIDGLLAPDLLKAAGAARELAISHGAQHAAQRLLGDDHAQFVSDPLAQIDDPPPHDPVNRRDRPAVEDRRQCRAMPLVQPRRLPWSLSVDETLRPPRVELERPVANDLQRHPADLGRLAPRGPVIDGRKSQQRRACGPSFERLAAARRAFAS
jgi:hypothetical protein